jgi:hypothetical protein
MYQVEESGEWMKRIASFFRDSLRISPSEAFLMCFSPASFYGLQSGIDPPRLDCLLGWIDTSTSLISCACDDHFAYRNKQSLVAIHHLAFLLGWCAGGEIVMCS